jgi:RNA polymerase sigma-70 factor (ECF subfamily)
MSTTSDDEADWARAVSGDGAAAGRIFDRHRDRIKRHSRRLVPEQADADDVVAVVFLEAWRKRDRIRFTEGSILPWMLVTATNTASNLTRSARRHRALLEKLPPGPDAPDPAESFPGEAEVALSSLSLRDQQVLSLCVLEDVSEKEAAVVLGIPPGTVKSRLFHAKKRLAANVGTNPEFRTLSVKEATHE